MATRQPMERRDAQPAFVLHTYAYRETSLIVEAFTADHGRVAMVARGAKRPRSETRGLLQAFQPLTLSWAGAGELKTLLKAEWGGGLRASARRGAAVRLLPERTAAEAAGARRPACGAVPRLPRRAGGAAAPATAAEQGAVLRRFELRLLAELGYALPLTHDADTGAAIDPAARYHYDFGRGPRALRANVAREPGARYPRIRGATLLGAGRQRLSGCGDGGRGQAPDARSARPLPRRAAHLQPPRRAGPAVDRRRKRTDR